MSFETVKFRNKQKRNAAENIMKIGNNGFLQYCIYPKYSNIQQFLDTFIGSEIDMFKFQVQ